MPASVFSSHRGTVGGNRSHIDYIATEVGEQELDVLRSSGLFRAGFMSQRGHRPAQASEAEMTPRPFAVPVWHRDQHPRPSITYIDGTAGVIASPADASTRVVVS